MFRFPPTFSPFFLFVSNVSESAYFRFFPRIFEPLLFNCCSIWSKKVSDFLPIVKKLFRNCVPPLSLMRIFPNLIEKI